MFTAAAIDQHNSGPYMQTVSRELEEEALQKEIEAEKQIKELVAVAAAKEKKRVEELNAKDQQLSELQVCRRCTCSGLEFAQAFEFAQAWCWTVHSHCDATGLFQSKFVLMLLSNLRLAGLLIRFDPCNEQILQQLVPPVSPCKVIGTWFA